MNAIIPFLLAAALGFAAGRPSVEENNGLRSIKFTKDGPTTLMNESEVLELVRKHRYFIDTTGLQYPKNVVLDEGLVPTAIRSQTTVTAALPKIQQPRLQQFLEHFTSYYNRNYTTETGVEAADWLLRETAVAITSSKYPGRASAYAYLHHEWAQTSVIARLQGSNSSIDNEVVILGAHIDTDNVEDPTGPQQGAADNAGGSGVLLEVLRVLLETGFVPQRSIEFHWYAAEEDGLLGSGIIANSYYNQGIRVAAMLNIDMVGYYDEVDKLGILVDEGYHSPKLTQFVRDIVNEYTTYEIIDKECGGPCSDHVNFVFYGYPVATPADPVIFPDRHTALDTIDKVNVTQLVEFTKLGVGYAVELGQPTISGAATFSVGLCVMLGLVALRMIN